MNTNAKEQPDWEQIAQQLRKPHGEFANEIGRRMNESNATIYQYTFESLDINDGMDILEIGMGNGSFVKDIINTADIRYTGIDYSKEMVDESLNNNLSFVEAGKANFFNMAIEDFPAQEPLYDRIFTINTLYFWDQPESVLKKVRSLLHYNGQLCISIRPKHVMENHPFTPHGFKLYTRGEVCALLEANGFNILAVIERKEPSIDALGSPMTFESLIVKATRNI